MSILITGGAKRCGRYLALELADSGHRVVITYNTSAEETLSELKDMGITCLNCDLTQVKDIFQLIQTIKQDFPDLMAIIHNASLWLGNSDETRADYLQSSMENFQTMFNVHMQAPATLNLALAKIMAENAKAANASANIIHFTDAIVNKAADNHIAYAATKAGLEHLTKSFAKKFAPYIRVNSIAPALLAFNAEDSEAYKAKVKGKHLLEPAPGFEVALKSVNYLLTNQYVTGSCLILDGGKSCL